MPTYYEALKKITGVYCLTDTHNGKHYIGSATGEGGVAGFSLLADYKNIIIAIVFIDQMVYNILRDTLDVLYDYGRND